MALYSPYHEMDIRQFVDKMNELVGLNQRELAELSGVPLRTIQQYEQRQKDINKAQAQHLVMLAQVLCCDMRDLMEKL